MSPKLDCPNTASKTYWSIINSFLNKKGCQIYHLSLITTNSYRIFIKKAELFNVNFVEQFTLFQNTSMLQVFNLKK